MKRIQIVLALAILGLCGCAHGQVTPAVHSVILTWTAPVNPVNPPTGAWLGCTTASPCTYVVSRAAGSSCPAFAYNPTVGGSGNYTPINQPSPANGATYTDSAAIGDVCYLVQTLQAGVYSGASNIVGPFTVPASPTAPVVNSNATVSEVKPETIDNNVAAPVLSAKVR